MRKLYEEPIVHISIFDDADDIITLSGTQSMSAEEQAMDVIAGEDSNVSIYSVDAKSN